MVRRKQQLREHDMRVFACVHACVVCVMEWICGPSRRVCSKGWFLNKQVSLRVSFLGKGKRDLSATQFLCASVFILEPPFKCLFLPVHVYQLSLPYTGLVSGRVYIYIYILFIGIKYAVRLCHARLR
jgi:hypothetical protein